MVRCKFQQGRDFLEVYTKVTPERLRQIISREGREGAKMREEFR
jgi:hypothetical protein